MALESGSRFVPIHPDDLAVGDYVQFEYVEPAKVAGWPSMNRTVKGTVRPTTTSVHLVVDANVAGDVKLVTVPRSRVIVSTVVVRRADATKPTTGRRRGWLGRR